MKIIGETRNYFIEEVRRSDLMSKTHKKVFLVLNHIFTYVVSGCVSVSAFSFMHVAIFPVGLNTCAITVGISNYQSVINKTMMKGKTHQKKYEYLWSKIRGLAISKSR